MVVVVIVGLVAFGIGSTPQVQKATSSQFSAERVVEDIREISKHHHSVAHPVERKVVRDYLIKRLSEIGADSVELFEYKSLTGPENKHVTYTFDATNVLATFNCKQASEAQTFLLLVAHYDSRYSQPMPKQDTVWSYGAADDGYGVGIILESITQALKYRDNWKQGVKVLFTDAEEVGMKGMKAMWQNNREVFEDVGFMINIEARGPFGPALLFETSPGNERLMELYKTAAKYPFTYSLTTVVYNFMPNFTDFTIVKDEIPGMNFSTIADINHYHTDLDNFDNINPKSIQHYGSQIAPIVHKYLTEEKFSELNYLKSDRDTINFTLPLLGLFNFQWSGYLWLNIAIFVLFILSFAVESLRGRVQVAKALSQALKTLLSALLALVVGEVIAYLCSAIAGASFKMFGIVQGVTFDNAVMIASAVVMVVVASVVHILQRRDIFRRTSNSLRASAGASAVQIYTTNKLYGTLTLLLVLSCLLLVFIRENLMFFIPLFAATLSVVTYRIVKIKELLLLAIALILLHALSFLYALTMALTIGAFGVVLMLALLDVLVVIPLAELYLSKQ